MCRGCIALINNLFCSSRTQLPHEDIEQLPPLVSDPPSKESTDAAVKQLIRLVHQEIKIEKANQRQQPAYDDSDGYDSGDGEDVEFADVITSPANTVVRQMSRYLPFINALPKCTVLNLGFHALVLNPGMDSWCYCPCGHHMATWRKCFDLDCLLEENRADFCNAQKRF